MIANHITDLIGNTPILKIDPCVHGLKNIDLYAKLEMMNPFGSVKDRIAWNMLKDHIPRIQAEGLTIFENSSGNTAKALQGIASTFGIKTRLITALAKVKEPKDIITLMGADIEEILGASECTDPHDPNDPQFIIQRAAKDSDNKVFFPSQFDNPDNPKAHYDTTAKEIAADLGRLDILIGGLGTSGTTLGIARALRETNPDMTCIGVCADKGDFIPGIRALEQLWEGGLFESECYQNILFIKSGDAIDAMMTLVRDCGLLCGPTSGANYLGSLQHLRNIDDTLTERKSALFIACDRLEWYISYIRERRPQLFGDEPSSESLFSFDESRSATTRTIPPYMADEWISRHQPLIIDTRSPAAFRMIRINGAINMPQEFFEPTINGHDPFPKDKPLLLICARGERTGLYAGYLQARGYQAYSLEGGIQAWRKLNMEKQRAA